MQNVERVAFVLLISLILAIMTVTLLMLLYAGTEAAGVYEGAAFVRGMTGGAA